MSEKFKITIREKPIDRISVSDKLTIHIDDDTYFHIQLNQFGELVLQKIQFGDKENSINIMPSVSNEIRLR